VPSFGLVEVGIIAAIIVVLVIFVCLLPWAIAEVHKAINVHLTKQKRTDAKRND